MKTHLSFAAISAKKKISQIFDMPCLGKLFSIMNVFCSKSRKTMHKLKIRYGNCIKVYGESGEFLDRRELLGDPESIENCVRKDIRW